MIAIFFSNQTAAANSRYIPTSDGLSLSILHHGNAINSGSFWHFSKKIYDLRCQNEMKIEALFFFVFIAKLVASHLEYIYKQLKYDYTIRHSQVIWLYAVFLILKKILGIQNWTKFPYYDIFDDNCTRCVQQASMFFFQSRQLHVYVRKKKIVFATRSTEILSMQTQTRRSNASN